MADIALPPVNRDMQTLDRSFFRSDLQTSAATVLNPKNIQTVRSRLNATRDVLATTTIKPIRDDDSHAGAKCILLRPHVKADDPTTWSENCCSLVQDGSIKIRPYGLVLKYEDWSMGEILDAVLPELKGDEEQNPAGFAQVGHVAHVNLRDQFLPYKHLIGQVLLDKNPPVKTVINKLHDVGTESAFRTFPYEVLAGPDDLNVTVSHLNCEFKFNFADVYWNTRLSHEHERLVATFQKGEAVCDVTAGVGPFAVPAGKRSIWVRANDLNPACYEAMKVAIRTNKVADYVSAACMDGSAFIRRATHELARSPRSFTQTSKVNVSRKATAKEKAEAQSSAAAKAVTVHEPVVFNHFVMNLPATGIEFLPVFRGLYQHLEHLFTPKGSHKLPLIHVYTFQAKRETEDQERQELQERLSHYLDYHFTTDDEIELHRARLVAPNKLFYCASFRLPPQVAFAQTDVACITDKVSALSNGEENT